MTSPWDILSSEPKEPRGVLNDRIVMKYDQFLNWDLLSLHYDFSIDLLRIYMHRVNWNLILKRIKYPEEFLREISPYLADCWATVSKYQTLSESFIHDFASEVEWESIIRYQNISGRFLTDHNSYIFSRGLSDISNQY